ncbi:hypothetical protein PR202_ga11382 [Eleusine coracana subsp. coracana]|uniref:Uncharacterized protein n=1 Tax=Eleusine coracana subsp. coracana TaxID=191504 RepID=A0AAV5C996_ELECO|nr:hypothetical protein PR202_ga11382 [Eleusine coracana subsp. coracana]
MMKNVQDEAERAIQRLNELGLGEDISYEEVQAYAARLPCSPPRVVIDVKPDYDQLNQLQIQNILYRIKFLKITRQMRKNGEGGYGYGNWTLYRGYFHSYEVELEYLRYWKELLKNLKECIETMRLDICWYKELDGVYFEIWKRIDKLKMTFRDALDCVYKLNTFPRYHLKMKAALDNDDWSNMEKEMAEDIAREFIADAIKSRRQRPKFYVHYIKKKIKIAGILGVIPKALQSTEKQLFEALVQ